MVIRSLMKPKAEFAPILIATQVRVLPAKFLSAVRTLADCVSMTPIALGAVAHWIENVALHNGLLTAIYSTPNSPPSKHTSPQTKSMPRRFHSQSQSPKLSSAFPVPDSASPTFDRGDPTRHRPSAVRGASRYSALEAPFRNQGISNRDPVPKFAIVVLGDVHRIQPRYFSRAFNRAAHVD